MQRRHYFRWNRWKIFSKKYIFNRHFLVRNTIAVLVGAAVIMSGAAGAYAVLTHSPENGKEVVLAAEPAEETVYSVDIPEIYSLQPETLTLLSEALEEDASLHVEVEEQEALTSAVYDMNGKFLVRAELLNMRAEADENAEVIATLSEGASGEVLGTEGEWTRVTSGGLTGFVKTEFILQDEEASRVAEQYIATIAQVKEAVRVRLYGSTDSEILYNAEAGEEFKVNEEYNAEGWVAVRLYNGSNGYISEDYVTLRRDFDQAVPKNKTREETDTKEEVTDTANRETATEAGNEDKTQVGTESTTQAPGAAEAPVEAPSEAVTEAPTEAPTEAATEAPTEAAAQSTSDLYLLAAIVYAESGAEPYEGQLAVANVVMNRLRSGRYGNTLSDVIYYPYQFSGIYTNNFKNALTTGGSSLSLQAAQEAMNGNNNIGSYIAFRPLWNIDTSSLSDYVIIGNHCFY